MSKIETSIDVHVRASTAYNQWTQFELFPRFMRHVEEVHQQDDRNLHWRTKLKGIVREWDAEIVEQIPDKRIAWRCTSGARHAGAVTFHRLGDERCRVMLQLEYDPKGVVERVGEFFGVPQREIEEDLMRFATFIEARSVETGAWRGRIPNADEARQEARRAPMREGGGRNGGPAAQERSARAQPQPEAESRPDDPHPGGDPGDPGR